MTYWDYIHSQAEEKERIPMSIDNLYSPFAFNGTKYKEDARNIAVSINQLESKVLNLGEAVTQLREFVLKHTEREEE